MKKTIFQSAMLLMTFFLIIPSLQSQSPQGIPYQAVARNADGSIMAQTPVNLTLTIQDGTFNGPVVYEENHALISNDQGLVSCVVGTGSPVQGSFASIDWGNGAKFLHVVMNGFDLGTQQLMSVPYALYSNNVGVRVSETGDSLFVGNEVVIVPGISAANYVSGVLGCMDNLACNYNSAATQSDNVCLYQDAACDDGNPATYADVINVDCICVGIDIINGCTFGLACNFNPEANTDDGSCLIVAEVCNDNNASTINDVITADCVCAGTPSLFVQGNGVTDIDGNFYPSIILGTQEWMQQNLQVTKYRNGQDLINAVTNSSWNTTNGAYGIYGGSNVNNTNYGKLYNWYAVNDSRGLCPTGWHVPTTIEWSTLENYLGGTSVAAGKLKTVDGWNTPNLGATNESGFTGLPGGYRFTDGTYWYNLQIAQWWTSTNANTTIAHASRLYYQNEGVINSTYDKKIGSSVRCLKD